MTTSNTPNDTRSLHDALPILVRTKNKEWINAGDGNQFLVLRISKETGAWSALVKAKAGQVNAPHTHIGPADFYVLSGGFDYRDRKSTRLNSSHLGISYAVFCF